MDVDLARIPAVKNWSREVDRTIATAEHGVTDSLIAVLGDGQLPTDLANRLVGASALPTLTEELATTASGPQLAGILVASPSGRELLAALVDGPVGAELSVLLARPDAAGPLGALADSNADVARSLARHLIESQSLRSEAEAILRAPSGRASAKDLLDHEAGQRVADRLGRDNTGLSLLDYLAKRPSVRHLALTLVADRSNHPLAKSLANCRGAQHLTSLVVAARERGPIAESLVSSRAGRAIAMSLQGTPQDRELVNGLVGDATGQRLMAKLGQDRDGPFSQQVAEQIAVLRLVVTVSLLLILVMEPLSIAALSLIVAGVVATDLAGSEQAEPEHAGSEQVDDAPSTGTEITTDAETEADGAAMAPSIAADETSHGAGEPATTPKPSHRSIRLTVDVGPGATMTELGTVLTDLDVLIAMAAEVALQPTVTGGGPIGDGSTREGITVTEARYGQPFELTLSVTDDLASVAHLVALAPMIRFWGLESTSRRAELGQVEAEFTAAETEALERLLTRIELSDPERTREVAAGLVGADSAVVTALDRLTGLSITVDPDTDVEPESESDRREMSLA